MFSSCSSWKLKLCGKTIKPSKAEKMEEKFLELYYPCLDTIAKNNTRKPVNENLDNGTGQLDMPEWYDNGRTGALQPTLDVSKVRKIVVKTTSSQPQKLVFLPTDEENSAVREVWYSIEELEAYFKLIKEEARKKANEEGTDFDYKKLGIRIYIGAYSDGEITFFLVPTKYIGKGDEDSSGFKDAINHENLYYIMPLNYGNTGQEPVDYNPPRN